MVCAAGEFTAVGGEFRDRLAGLDAATGAADAWNPKADGPVHCFMAAGTSLYAGGEFLHVGSRPVYHMTAFRSGPSLTVTRIVAGAGGEVELRVRDGTGQGTEWVVERTTDWVHWNEVGSGPVCGQPTPWVDTNAAVEPVAIYRAVTR
jgi:hypothetical protein